MSMSSRVQEKGPPASAVSSLIKKLASEDPETITQAQAVAMAGLSAIEEEHGVEARRAAQEMAERYIESFIEGATQVTIEWLEHRHYALSRLERELADGRCDLAEARRRIRELKEGDSV